MTMTATIKMTTHYYTVSSVGASNAHTVIERRHTRIDGRPMTAAEARGEAMDVAEESAKYAKVRIDWSIDDAPDGDGWIVTASQWHRPIGKHHVRYAGIDDPRTARRNGIYSEHSRHVDDAEARQVVADLKSQGRYAEVWLDSYAGRPHRVMVKS